MSDSCAWTIMPQWLLWSPNLGKNDGQMWCDWHRLFGLQSLVVLTPWEREEELHLQLVTPTAPRNVQLHECVPPTSFSKSMTIFFAKRSWPCTDPAFAGVFLGSQKLKVEVQDGLSTFSLTELSIYRTTVCMYEACVPLQRSRMQYHAQSIPNLQNWRQICIRSQISTWRRSHLFREISTLSFILTPDICKKAIGVEGVVGNLYSQAVQSLVIAHTDPRTCPSKGVQF